jgi:hypothetical protein
MACAETGTRLVFRFIGHYYLRENHAGIQTLADPRFEKELRHYIREADLIVLSTFAHNGYTGQYVLLLCRASLRTMDTQGSMLLFFPFFGCSARRVAGLHMVLPPGQRRAREG